MDALLLGLSHSSGNSDSGEWTPRGRPAHHWVSPSERGIGIGIGIGCPMPELTAATHGNGLYLSWLVLIRPTKIDTTQREGGREGEGWGWVEERRRGGG